jgi:hypothetical protein
MLTSYNLTNKKIDEKWKHNQIYQMYRSFKFQNFQLLKMMYDDIFNQWN